MPTVERVFAAGFFWSITIVTGRFAKSRAMSRNTFAISFFFTPRPSWKRSCTFAIQRLTSASAEPFSAERFARRVEAVYLDQISRRTAERKGVPA